MIVHFYRVYRGWRVRKPSTLSDTRSSALFSSLPTWLLSAKYMDSRALHAPWYWVFRIAPPWMSIYWQRLPNTLRGILSVLGQRSCIVRRVHKKVRFPRVYIVKRDRAALHLASTQLPPKISPSVETLYNFPKDQCISQASTFYWAAALYAKWEYQDKKKLVEGSKLVNWL